MAIHRFKSGSFLTGIVILSIFVHVMAGIAAEVIIVTRWPYTGESAVDAIMMSDAIRFFAYFIAAGTFLRWFFRVHRNVGALGMRGLRETNDAAVTHFLIPFVNLVRPRKSAQDIWRASDPLLVGALDAEAWKTNKGSSLINIWWWLFVSSTLLSPFAFGWADYFLTVPYLASAMMCALVMRDIDARQQAGWVVIETQERELLRGAMKHKAGDTKQKKAP